MNRRPHRKKKLVLTSQVIRTLTNKDLRIVGGGCDTTSFTTEVRRRASFQEVCP
jgi:hypothetical protein